MIKKAIILLFAFATIFTFASCKNNNNKNTESTISEATVSNNDIESAIVEESSEKEVSTISDQSIDKEISEEVDKIYYGNGYSFVIPKGFTVEQEAEDMVTFLNPNYLSFYVQTVKMPDNVNYETEENFKDFYGDSVTAFE